MRIARRRVQLGAEHRQRAFEAGARFVVLSREAQELRAVRLRGGPSHPSHLVRRNRLERRRGDLARFVEGLERVLPARLTLQHAAELRERVRNLRAPQSDVVAAREQPLRRLDSFAERRFSVRAPAELLQEFGAQALGARDGTFDFHFSQMLMQQYALPAGERLYAQYWHRDPGFAFPNNVGLSNALRFDIAQ